EGNSTPLQVSSLSGITAISAGLEFSLALKQDGTVWAWGENGVGQLGNGNTAISPSPVQVVGPGGSGNLSGISTIVGASFGNHSLALRASDGTVWAWGDNSKGQLGDNSTTSTSVPIQVSGLSGVGLVGAGALHSIAA